VILQYEGQEPDVSRSVYTAPETSEAIEMEWKNALAELRTEIELCTGNPVTGLEGEKECYKEDCGDVVLQKIREEVKFLKKYCDDQGEAMTKEEEIQQELQELCLRGKVG